MGGKDSALKTDIENILQGQHVGRELIAWFERIPAGASRRAITVLARLYPEKTTATDEELAFIIFMLSHERWLEQESFPAFIQAIGIIDFSDDQKQSLIPVVKAQFEALCKRCTFELDHLIRRLFSPQELARYMEQLVTDSDSAVLEHILDMLRYEDFTDSNVSDETVENLRQTASHRLEKIKLSSSEQKG